MSSLLYSDCVIHCTTEEIAIEVLSLASQYGLKWCDGYSFEEEENQWCKHQENTCYDLLCGQFCDIEWSEKNEPHKNIITGEEFLKFNSTQNSFNIGDLVTLKSNPYATVFIMVGKISAVVLKDSNNPSSVGKIIGINGSNYDDHEKIEDMEFSLKLKQV